MEWFCDSEQAKEHKRTCKKNPNECDECVWIDESGLAMGRYGKEVEIVEEPHPLTDYIIEKFNGRIING